MIVLRMAGKILLLPVWLLLATAHLLVKIAVEIYCIGKGIINLILGFMLIGTLLWYRQWERFALLAVAGGSLAVLSVDWSVYGSYTGISTTQNWKMDYTDIKKVSART